jgi:predicted secreted hydrolase
MKKSILICCFLLSGIGSISSQNWQSYPYAPSGSMLSFPTDDGKHVGIRYKTEWWYLNLHLVGSAPAFKPYDVMLCYFSMPATMRLFNISTPSDGLFHTDVNQPFLGYTFTEQAAHWGLHYSVPVSSINDSSSWTYPFNSKTFDYKFLATSSTNNDQLNITLGGNKPPLMVGGNGFIAIGTAGDSSYYYSNTNMNVKGTVRFAGVTDTITSGIGWIDRQFGPFTVGTNPNNYYEWFSMQVDKPGTTWGTPQTGSEYNVWQIFSDSNSVPFHPASRMVSAMYADNSQDTISNYIYERTSYWHDVANNKFYSHGWRYINPARGINLDMTPSVANQVINVTLFKFWEGGTTLKGTVGNQPVDGLGFAELVAGHNTMINVPGVPGGLGISPHSDHYSVSWTASTPGTYPLGGYRVYRSTTNDGHWEYVGTTTNLFYDDYMAPLLAGSYYTVSSFDNQSATSASNYATAIWAAPTGIIAYTLSERNIEVSPNPAGNQMTVALSGSAAESPCTLDVYTLTGQLVQSQHLVQSKTIIDLSSFQPGMYILRLSNAGSVAVKKLLKD